MSKSNENRVQGKNFEIIFDRQAKMDGLWVRKNHLTAIMGPNGKLIRKDGDLDYRLINRIGRIGYFDCKSFNEDHFVYSQINSVQLEKAVQYNLWFIPAGFVVYLIKTGQVFFYSGQTIASAGPGRRFTAKDGVCLGPVEDFDLKRIVA